VRSRQESLTVAYSNHERTPKVQTATAYLEPLNPEQRRAVEHGPAGGLAATRLLVIAGADSGKDQHPRPSGRPSYRLGSCRRILLMT
jgi:DNA helicase-2/ATP-dependent DNA helicase PcrA